MKRNVLIFAAAPYCAMAICDCLKYNMLFHPIAASSYPNHAEFVYREYVDDLPFVNAPDFIEKFAALIREKNAEFVIPTDDMIALILTKYQDQIPAKVVCSSYETTKICRYKSLTYKTLADAPYVPKWYACREAVEKYPVFVKPDDGAGSVGTARVDAAEGWEAVGDLTGKVICEYLPGEEYTVDCFTDRFGKLLFWSPRSRSRLIHGMSARGYSLPRTEEFREIIEDLNRRISFRGYWFAQLKRDKNGALKLMELCVRFAGTFGVSKGLGVNLPLMALCDAAQMDTAAIVNDYQVVSDKTYIDRYRLSIDYDTVYVDYDDTITCEGGTQVNPYVMAFLYQCKNKRRKIILLTRHTADKRNSLSEDMERLSIPVSLFAQIHDLTWEEEKSDYITEKPAIFLDNSFAQRQKVHDQCGIPVFDVANIDCLFDWR